MTLLTMRIMVLGSREPWQMAIFRALAEVCEVIHLQPQLSLEGWLPRIGDERATMLPRGIHSHRQGLVKALAPMCEQRLLKAYGTAGALIITEPYYWAYAKYFQRLAPITAYHVSDDYAHWPAARLELERRLVPHVDLIFPVSKLLGEVLQQRHGIDPKRIHITPNGVPAAWIPPAPPERPSRLPEQIPAWFRPLIGVIGTIGSRVDLQPIAAAHDALPELYWVFVGPVRKDVPGLRHLQNSPRCRFIGHVPYDAMQPYFAAVDAAVLPLTDDDINPCSSPVRFFSQLPTGQPILDLGTCHQLREVPNLSLHCRGSDDLIKELSKLHQVSFLDGHAAARHRLAMDSTWQRRADVIARALRLQL